MEKKANNNINRGRRDALKAAGLFVAAFVGSSMLDKIGAAALSVDDMVESDQQQRIVRKAVFVSKNCKVHKQIASKAKNLEDCLLCIDACPRKAIEQQEADVNGWTIGRNRRNALRFVPDCQS